jgi:hypothetical protein
MGTWRGKYLDTGPPRGPGHYSEDGHWWWDDTHRLTTLSSRYGNGYFRFLARARSADPRWPTDAMAGATFPVTRPSPEDVAAQGAWLDTQRERFQELHQQLREEGWRPAGHGAYWWSAIYRRPAIGLDTPPDAYNRTQRSA